MSLARFAAVVASQGLALEHPWRGAGRIEDVPVRMTLELHDERPRIVLDVDFDPPLDLAFRAHPLQLRDAAERLSLDEDILFKDAKFDRAYRIRGIDRASVTALCTPAVQQALMETRVAADDAGMRAVLAVGAPAVASMLRRFVIVARAVREALPGVPPPGPLAECVPRWQAFARERGLSMRVWPMRLAGRSREHDVLARSVFDGAAYGFEVDVTHAAPLGIALSVKQVQDVAPIDRDVGLDIRVGHAAFDDAYVVRAKDARRARELLDAEVCTALHALGVRRGELSLDDTRIHVSIARPDADLVPTVVDEIIAVSRLMSRLPDNVRSPYR
jgi:hypothetical protein